MSRKLPSETIKWLENFQKDIRKQSVELGDNSTQYFIPINLTLAIVKNPNRADIILSSGAGGQQQAIVTEVPKYPDKTHPHRRKEVVELVNQRLNGEQVINGYDINCIVEVYKISSRAEFRHKPKYSSPQYSERFIEWIINNVTKNSPFFTITRQKVKQKETV